MIIIWAVYKTTQFGAFWLLVCPIFTQCWVFRLVSIFDSLFNSAIV